MSRWQLIITGSNRGRCQEPVGRSRTGTGETGNMHALEVGDQGDLEWGSVVGYVFFWADNGDGKSQHIRRARQKAEAQYVSLSSE